MLYSTIKLFNDHDIEPQKQVSASMHHTGSSFPGYPQNPPAQYLGLLSLPQTPKIKVLYSTIKLFNDHDIEPRKQVSTAMHHTYEMQVFISDRSINEQLATG